MYEAAEFKLEIVSHGRWVKDGFITEEFIIDAFNQDGSPLDWHPNQDGVEDFLGIKNRVRYQFIGKESIPVVQAFKDGFFITEAEATKLRRKGEVVEYRVVGTKRGADFRTNFWTNLVYRARKAIAASTGGKTIKDVVNTEVSRQPFVEPENLKELGIEEAIDILIEEKLRANS